jgi:hypothetical protein
MQNLQHILAALGFAMQSPYPYLAKRHHQKLDIQPHKTTGLGGTGSP